MNISFLLRFSLFTGWLILMFVSTSCEISEPAAAADPAPQNSSWMVMGEPDSLVLDSAARLMGLLMTTNADTTISPIERSQLKSRYVAKISHFYRKHQMWDQYANFNRTILRSEAVKENYFFVEKRWEQIRDSVIATSPPTSLDMLLLTFYYAVSQYELGYRKEAAVTFDRYFRQISEMEANGISLPIELLVTSSMANLNLAIFDRNYPKADRILTDLEKRTAPYLEDDSLSKTLPILLTRSLITQGRGFLYFYQGQQEASIRSFKESAALLEGDIKKDNDPRLGELATALFQIGYSKHLMGNHELAIPYLLRVLNLYNNLPFRGPFPIAVTEGLLATVHYQLGNIEEGDKHYANSWGQIIRSDRKISLLEPPKLEELYQDPRTLELLLETVKILAPSIQQPEKVNPDSLRALRAYCDLSLDLIDSLRTKSYYSLDNSSQILTDSSYLIYDQGISATLSGENWQPYQNVVIEPAITTILSDSIVASAELARAFAIADQSRGGWITENTIRGNISALGVEDAALLELERKLDYELRKAVDLQIRLHSLGESPELDQVVSDITRLEQQQDSLIQVIRTTYPDYYTLKYAPTKASIERVQKELLGPQDAWLEYFIGQREIFTFLITPHHSQVFRQPIPPAFYEELETVKKMQQNQDEKEGLDIDAYRVAASSLYRRLLASAVAALFERGERWYLTVVPHQGLIGLDLGILLSEEVPDRFLPYHQWPYLEKNEALTISYEISTSLALTQFQKRQAASRQTAWFGGKSESVKPLDSLARHMANRYGGDYYQGDEAAFKANGSRYDLLYFGAVGQAKAANQFAPRIFLAEEPNEHEDNILTLEEISGQRLSASLAVIQSCETSLGAFHVSEGILSVGRAFRVAGVPATMTALWEIPVEESIIITNVMMSHLETGMRPEEALQRAKIAYIQANTHGDAVPWKWAGLVQQGHVPAGFRVERSTPWWVWLLAGAVLTMGLGWFLLARKRQVT
ncbi:MAG: CHAT domain-containing protein [Bacteroidia bacterium]|nr:CHAT domain-containing protein [Bacteroidia bacterium]